MIRRARSTEPISRLLDGLAARVLAFGFLCAEAAVAQPLVWHDGAASQLQHLCVIGQVQQVEDLTWTWTGFYGFPRVGEVYYARIVVGGLGCSGAWARPEVKLPAATSFAISSANPVRCLYQRPNEPAPVLLTDGSCPAQPVAGLYPTSGSFPNPGGGYPNEFFAFLNQLEPTGYWPLPAGVTMAVEFPVVSLQQLSGIAGNDYLLGAVGVLDLNSLLLLWDGHESTYGGGGVPSQGPWQGVFVAPVPEVAGSLQLGAVAVALLALRIKAMVPRGGPDQLRRGRRSQR